MKKLILALFRFIATSLRWSRALLANLLFLFVVIIIIEAFHSAPEIEIPNNSALVLAPSGILVEQNSYQPSIMDVLNGGPEQAPETVLSELIRAIKLAQNDKHINGLILNLNYLHQASMSKVEELGQAIEDFKTSNKPVVAFADYLSQQNYLLAAYADEIYINPMGAVHLTGFGIYRNYYKSAADSIALKFHVFRSGKYKDAVEPFIRDNMSEQSREHLSTWLNENWQRYVETISEQRALPQNQIQQLVQELDLQMQHYRGDTAQLALDAGLVDAVLSRQELKEKLAATFGQNKDKQANVISMHGYLNNPLLAKQKKSDKQIGLIVAQGNILDGYQEQGKIGSDSLSALITQAREDDNIVALVLRIDSGGGSAFASEVIREQLQLTREQGKKVYISMSTYTASGGYWIATAADEIWANASTLTGSIGVFGLIPNFSGTLNKVGVYSDGVGTSPFADAWQLDREMSPQTQSIIQSGVDHTYQRFISLVAESREQDIDTVDNIAQGHIWSGLKAQEIGLVDELGSLDELLTKVKNEYQLSGDSVHLIERQLSPGEQLMKTLIEQSSVRDLGVQILSKEARQSAELLRQLSTHIQQLPIALQPQSQSYQHTLWAECMNCVAP